MEPSPLLLQRTLKKSLLEAGKVIRYYWDRSVQIEHKGKVDLVTTADKKADKAILKTLKKEFPKHIFLTEESGQKKQSSRYRWIIDPLDGTTNFAHRVPHLCVSIGLEKDGQMEMGGIYDPLRKEMFLARRGKGATLNGKPIQVSSTKKLIDSLLVTGFPYDRRQKAAYYLSYEKLMKQTQGIRRMGAAALDLAYVAAGRFDGYYEYRLQPWDVAAGWLIVEEAGGQLTSLMAPLILFKVAAALYVAMVRFIQKW